ncbi:MAG: copper homeostasis protein CutC [Clostridia bacterium]|nr:copper homeostasis protein CutC [Clostridia bacterium]
MEKNKVEVCANSLFSAIEAQEGGAFRVELCDNIPEGGTTPSAGLIVSAREKLKISLHVLIRPRGGDFLYSDVEFEIMKKDIHFCRQAGVNGVVFGILDKYGHMDIRRNTELLELARPMQCVFHRAIDVSADWNKTLQDILYSGFDGVLTSGGAPAAWEGRERIKAMRNRAGNDCCIIPGSGINISNIQALKEYTGASIYHLSGRRSFPSEMIYKNKLPMGSFSAEEEWTRAYTDRNIIKQIISLLNGV